MYRTLLLVSVMLTLAACEEYRGFDHMYVTDESFTGTIDVEEVNGNVNIEFLGLIDSGTYGFIWDNPG